MIFTAYIAISSLMFSKNRLKFLVVCFFSLFFFSGLLKAEPNVYKKDQIDGITLLKDKDYYPILLQRIKQAKKSIFITAYVFKAHYNNLPEKLANALIAANSKNIKVTLFLEKSNHRASINKINQVVFDKLKKAGVRVVWDSPKTQLHAKTVVIDNYYSFIGSHNLTQSALYWNKELSILIDSNEVAEDILNYFNTISLNKK